VFKKLERRYSRKNIVQFDGKNYYKFSRDWCILTFGYPGNGAMSLQDFNEFITVCDGFYNIFPPGFYPTEGMTQQDIAERLRVTKIDAVNSVPITFTRPVDLITVIDYLCGRYVSWIDGQKGNSLYKEA